MRHPIRLSLNVALGAMLMLVASCKQEIPLVYDVENTGAEFALPVLPSFDELPVVEPLTDPLLWSDGSGRVKNFKDWKRRRAEIIRELEHYEVGEKPVVPKECVDAIMDGDTLKVKVTVNGEVLTIKAPISYPEGEGPFPAIIGIGWGAGSLPLSIFKERNIATIGFNFSQVMSHTQKRGQEPINKLYPDQLEMGSYTAWPWGVSRLIDGLEIVGASSKIDTKHLAISGCSFAGKMALFAGAQVFPVDIGIASDDIVENLTNRKVRKATRDFLIEPAMTRQEVLQAILVGIEEVAGQSIGFVQADRFPFLGGRIVSIGCQLTALVQIGNAGETNVFRRISVCFLVESLEIVAVKSDIVILFQCVNDICGRTAGCAADMDVQRTGVFLCTVFPQFEGQCQGTLGIGISDKGQSIQIAVAGVFDVLFVIVEPEAVQILFCQRDLITIFVISSEGTKGIQLAVLSKN